VTNSLTGTDFRYTGGSGSVSPHTQATALIDQQQSTINDEYRRSCRDADRDRYRRRHPSRRRRVGVVRSVPTRVRRQGGVGVGVVGESGAVQQFRQWFDVALQDRGFEGDDTIDIDAVARIAARETESGRRRRGRRARRRRGSEPSTDRLRRARAYSTAAWPLSVPGAPSPSGCWRHSTWTRRQTIPPQRCGTYWRQ